MEIHVELREVVGDEVVDVLGQILVFEVLLLFKLFLLYETAFGARRHRLDDEGV